MQNDTRAIAFQYRLNGLTYAEIGKRLNLSRQRVQQLLQPSREVRDYVVAKYSGKCALCGLFVGKSGHIHHKKTAEENYNDVENLELLCISCHRCIHNSGNCEPGKKVYRFRKIGKKSLEVTFPFTVIEEQAKMHELSTAQFMKLFHVIAIPIFGGVHYSFEKIAEEETIGSRTASTTNSMESQVIEPV